MSPRSMVPVRIAAVVMCAVVSLGVGYGIYWLLINMGWEVVASGIVGLLTFLGLLNLLHPLFR